MDVLPLCHKFTYKLKMAIEAWGAFHPITMGYTTCSVYGGITSDIATDTLLITCQLFQRFKVYSHNLKLQLQLNCVQSY